MSECNHRQCSLCLRRECREYVGKLQKFSFVFACSQCIHKSVVWAYQCATSWGGDCGSDVCGYKEKAAMPVEDSKQEAADAAKP
jgi:hypothetical protein